MPTATTTHWTDAQARTEFRSAAAKHQRQFRDLIAARFVDYGAPRRLVGLDVGVGDVADVLRASFPGGTALVLYELDESGLKAWAIGPAEFVAARIPVGRAQLSLQIQRLLQSLDIERKGRSRRPVRRDVVADYQDEHPARQVDAGDDAVRLLSNLLFSAPIARLIQSPAVKHVVIVPSGELGTVPFSLLRLDDLHLVDHVSTTIAPSLGDLFPNEEDRHAATHIDTARAVVVGNPAYGDPQWHLPDLPGAEREARAVAARFGVEPLIGERATIHSVLSKSDPGLIYLATHGVASDDAPLDTSFIALTPVPSYPGSERWTARQIQHSRLGAQLVVLSACQTGLGATHDAGVIGLARAFQLAGCQQVVMSLWSVDDTSTAELMARFAGHICSGLHAPEALRRSSIELRDNGAEPWQWSSFTVFAGIFG